MRKLLNGVFLFLACVTCHAGNNFNVLDRTTPTVTGGTIDNAVIGSTTPAAGTFTDLTLTRSLSSTATSTSTASGNVNFTSNVVTINPASQSSTVFAGGLNQCYYVGSGGFDSTGHIICGLGYFLMNSPGQTVPLAFGLEGKTEVLAGTVTNLSSVRMGLADIAAGATVTTWTGASIGITDVHGTLVNAKGLDFSITANHGSPIQNAFPINIQDADSTIATNLGAFRCQVTNRTAHYCLYADGDGQNYVKGKVYVGDPTGVDNGSGAQLQVTGSINSTGLTANTMLYANSSKIITSTAAPTNGQLLIGSTGAAPVLTALTGTANQVIVTNGAGSSTLSLPQSIATSSSPTFANVITTGQGSMPVYTGAGAAINAPHTTAGSCVLSAGSCTVNFSGSAAFLNSGSYNCVGNDTGGSAIAVSVQNQSGSQIKIFSGALADTATYLCTGS